MNVRSNNLINLSGTKTEEAFSKVSAECNCFGKSMIDKSIKFSPLEEFHKENSAKLIEFAGWSMPIQYTSGIINEHISTRESCGLFDISHMGQIFVSGNDSKDLLEKLTPSDIEKIKPGKVKYSFLLNNEGGIIDDLMITNEGEGYYLVVNASRINEGLSEIKKTSQAFSNISINYLNKNGMIALQGPNAKDIVFEHFGEISQKMYFMDFSKVNYDGNEVRISRLGYTGEDGFEISSDSKTILKITKNISKDKRVTLCGLGSRDTLRLEAGLPLYGNELNENTTPIQADLSFAISQSRIIKKNFRGAQRIMNEIENGSELIRVGLKPEGRRPVRKGTPIMKNGEHIGEISSGGYGPTIKSPIAMGIIKSEFLNPNESLQAKLGDNLISMEIIQLPFVKHNYFKKGKI